ncbi:ribonuclease H-like domain-containing protein [Tanacetum coccineum]
MGVASGSSNTDLNLHVNNPLYLHANDSNETPLITFKLTGINNYKIWAVVVHLALHTKNKLGFIDRKCVRDENDVLLQEQWDRWNTITFTPDQINRLMALIGLKSDSSELQSYAADSGATQHMTFFVDHLYDVIDVSHLKISVAHPNGTIEMVKHVGNYKLSDKITLRDVLVVPRYKVSLISIHKLAKDDKFVVSFTESKCLAQDSLLKSLVGSGSENNVLYMFDSDKMQIDSLDSIQPCDVCHKAKKTREPFLLSDHKTKCLDSSLGDSDGITKSLNCADVSTDTLPTVTSQHEEVVTKSPIRPSNSIPDDLGNSGASPKGDDATLYDDEYKSKCEDFVDFNHLLDSDQRNIPGIVCVAERKDFYNACMMCYHVGSIIDY